MPKGRYSLIRFLCWTSLVLLGATASTLAQEEDLDATYGQGNQSEGRYSINGTGVGGR